MEFNIFVTFFPSTIVYPYTCTYIIHVKKGKGKQTVYRVVKSGKIKSKNASIFVDFCVCVEEQCGE